MFVTIFFSSLQAKNLEKFDRGDSISDYFSGILLLNDNQYNKSYRFLKRLNGLEERHLNYSSKYLYALVNLGNTINERSYDEQLMEDVEDSYHSISGDVSSVGLNSVHLISPTDIDSGFKYEEEHKSFGSEISVTESNDINIEEEENTSALVYMFEEKTVQ